MDLPRKLDIAKQANASIATHDDEDAAVRIAALTQVKADADARIADINAEVAAQIAAKFPAPTAPTV